ncbi:hypothetical protein [Thiohalocapsa halophila]|uniref:hypothetical protein n=1 Tax=Thiohalocapsa halophila TaxID=69359 RepID=UPI001904C6F2|nr:hypothetical protein [Thiohalocapsa halophila]
MHGPPRSAAEPSRHRGPQQLSRTTVGAYKTCIEVAWCGEDADPAAIGYVRVERAVGGTAPGSSGSGLFGAGGLVLRTNLGGSDAEAFDYYGRPSAPHSHELATGLGRSEDKPISTALKPTPKQIP